MIVVLKFYPGRWSELVFKYRGCFFRHIFYVKVFLRNGSKALMTRLLGNSIFMLNKFLSIQANKNGLRYSTDVIILSLGFFSRIPRLIG